MKKEKRLTAVCLWALIVLFVSVLIRAFVWKVCVNRLNMHNDFTEIVLAGLSLDEEEKGGDTESTDIDWGALYPFPDTGQETNVPIDTMESWEEKLFSKYTLFVNLSKFKIEDTSKDYVVGYSEMIKGARLYNQVVDWNYASYSEYNSFTALPDGYLTGFVSPCDTSGCFTSLSGLHTFCKKKNIHFLYVQAPYKISKYDDKDISGKQDFSNQNADALLQKLNGAGIDCYDLREAIHNENLYHHGLFYRTDHHWLGTTGLWAAQRILGYCNEKYGWNADLSLLEADQFEYEIYENWFLGSYGKKATLVAAKPDDFTLLYPKYKTSFSYVIPDFEIDKTGDYSVVYNMSEVEEKDYYNKNPYAVYNYGNRPLIQIENRLEAEPHKILMIHDSFGASMLSCLGLAEKHIDALDLRHFTGSVQAYIEATEPDLVLVMYNPDVIGQLDDTSHESLFDFR